MRVGKMRVNERQATGTLTVFSFSPLFLSCGLDSSGSWGLIRPGGTRQLFLPRQSGRCRW
jgi:hypothetical protein